jgi:hypothetical protein
LNSLEVICGRLGPHPADLRVRRRLDSELAFELGGRRRPAAPADGARGLARTRAVLPRPRGRAAFWRTPSEANRLRMPAVHPSQRCRGLGPTVSIDLVGRKIKFGGVEEFDYAIRIEFQEGRR